MSDAVPQTTAVVEDLSTDGRGVARVGERACFIPGTYPGDTVRIEIDAAAEPPAGHVLEYVELSPDRVNHVCPHADECPASPWGRLAYERQLEAKRRLVARTLRKAIGEVDVLPAVASPQPWHYRGRVTLTVWKEGEVTRVGYQTEARSESGVALRTCKLAAEPVDELFGRLAGHIERQDVPDDLAVKRMQLHRTSGGAGLMLIFARYPAAETIRFWTELLGPLDIPGGTWIAQGTRAGIVGHGMRVTRLGPAEPMAAEWMGHPLQIHPAAFTQANGAAAEQVHQRLREFGAQNDPGAVWDLYGGYGALGFALAGGARPVTVMDVSAYAERTFADIARMARNPGSRFVRGDLLTTLLPLAKTMAERDVVVLDPPRSGAHAEVLSAIGKSHVRHVIYLSCNAARLGRDLKALRGHGFAPVEIQPHDFFPHTPTIETLAILQR